MGVSEIVLKRKISEIGVQHSYNLGNWQPKWNSPQTIGRVGQPKDGFENSGI